MELFTLLIIAVIVIISLIKSSQNSDKIKSLKWELNKLRNQINSFQQSKTLTIEKTPQEKTTDPVTPIPTADVKKQDHILDIDELITKSSKSSKEIVGDHPKKTSEKRSRTKDEWEVFVGGKLLNRVGALALIIALGYFLKYAFDNNLISETVRVLIGVAIGIILIAGGFRFYKKDFKIFYQGLAGAGIAILYLSIYASFNYYSLVSQPMAFGLMSVITIITFIQAFYYDSLTVSLLGWTGGFLTPFLLSTGQVNEIGLFTYIILLDLGLIIIILKKDAWVVLEVLTITATYIVFYSWYGEYYNQEKLMISILFLTLFWSLFFAINLIHAFNATRTYIGERQTFTTINIACYYVGLYLMINSIYHEWMGLVTIILSIIYFNTFFLLKRRQLLLTYQQIFSLMTAITLLTVSIAVQFEKFMILTFWAVEALIILWLGINSKKKFLWYVGIIIAGLILIKFITIQETFIYLPIKSFNPFFNLRTLSFISVSILFGLGAYLFSKSDIKKADQLRILFNCIMCSLLILLSIVEIGDYFRKLALLEKGYSKDQILFLKSLSWSIGYSVLSLFFIFYGYRKILIEVVIFGLIALGLCVLTSLIFGITYIPLDQFTPIINFRAIVMVSILIAMTVQIIWLKKYQNLFDWLEDIYKIFQIGIIILILALITGEVRDFFEKKILYLEPTSAEYISIINLQQMILSSSWLLFSIVLLVIGIWKRVQIIRITAIIIFGIAIFKIFLYDLSYLEALYRIISFMGLGLILLFASYLYQKYKKILF